MLNRIRALFERGMPRVEIRGAMLTDTGSVRDGNEDSVAFVLHEEAGLAVVADGMGGHAAGEEASRLAVATILRCFFAHSGTVPGRIAASLAAANAAILARSAEVPEFAGMGTTCTLLAFVADEVFLGHVGDSRAYRIRAGVADQISRDHSLVADLVAQGHLSPDEAANSPERNVILRALGIGPAVEPQVPARGEKLLDGDIFVICSDGLSDLVPIEAIADAVSAREPQEACEALVQAALDAGGHDNVSVGVFKAGAAAPAAEPNRTRELDVKLP